MKTEQKTATSRRKATYAAHSINGEVWIEVSSEKCADAEKIHAIYAAAPELLVALEIAEATLQRLAPNGSRATQGTRDLITSALAKAKGE